MGQTQILTGAQAAALAARLCRVQVIAAYPITPQSKIPEVLSEYVESGQLKAEFVRVESEHSAMTVCISASLVGARVFTATAANGLAYMHEQLHWAAGARLPIVMPVTNRGLGAPWTILNDMQDTIAQRDTGWIQLYCMNNQEVLDLTILAYRIAEQLLIPVMVCFDGFRLSHTVMPVEGVDQEQVDAFLPPYKPAYRIDAENPVNINPVVLSDPIPAPDGELCPGYMGFRARLQKSFENAWPVITDAAADYARLTGRSYEDCLYRYQADDADFLFVTMGSLSSEATETTDNLRARGVKAGVIGLRVFRPFPSTVLAAAVSQAKTIAVVEKAISYGYEGALATELKAALFSHNGHHPFIYNAIVGLGGKDVKPKDLEEIALDATAKCAESREQEHPLWFGYGI